MEHVGSVKKILAASALLMIAACVPVDFYHRVGVTPAKQSSDLVNCQTAALRDVPPNNQVRQTPLVVTPTQTKCYANEGKTECVTTGGEVSGGELYTVDANEDLRGNVVTQCMAAKGYHLYSVPRCQASDIRGRTIGYRTLPPISPNACVTKARSGAWVIVNL